MKSNNLVLNRFFTQYIFKDLLDKHLNATYKNIISRYIYNYEKKSNRELIRDIYNYMSKAYRNEYFYQNTLLNKLLLGRHSLKTTTALTQIPIGKSKADFILINGKAVVYEIKTELDTFERLGSQLNDYYKAFNFVNVVTCEENYNRLVEILKETPVGIIVLTSRNTFSKKLKKEAVKYDDKLDHYEIFKILYKKEVDSILEAVFGEKPKTTPVKYYNACLETFKTIPIDTAYKMFLERLKLRNDVIDEQFKVVPYELKSLMYFSKFSYMEYHKLNKFLQYSYEG